MPPSVSQKKSNPQTYSLENVGMRHPPKSRMLMVACSNELVFIVCHNFVYIKCFLSMDENVLGPDEELLEDKDLLLSIVPTEGRALQRRERGRPWKTEYL